MSVLSELESVRAREGDSATFECTVSEADTARSWALGGRPLRPGGRVRIRQEGLRGWAPPLLDRPRPVRQNPPTLVDSPPNRPAYPVSPPPKKPRPLLSSPCPIESAYPR